jgi:hypothetical protein
MAAINPEGEKPPSMVLSPAGGAMGVSGSGDVAGNEVGVTLSSGTGNAVNVAERAVLMRLVSGVGVLDKLSPRPQARTKNSIINPANHIWLTGGLLENLG